MVSFLNVRCVLKGFKTIKCKGKTKVTKGETLAAEGRLWQLKGRPLQPKIRLATKGKTLAAKGGKTLVAKGKDIYNKKEGMAKPNSCQQPICRLFSSIFILNFMVLESILNTFSRVMRPLRFSDNSPFSYVGGKQMLTIHLPEIL